MDDNDIKLARELLDALEKAIDEGPWDKGLLFQTIGKRLKGFREELEGEINAYQVQTHQQKAADETPEQSGEEIIVYVSLYMIEGAHIDKWEKFLNALGNNAVTRPIYKHEEDLRTALRAKENKINDGYAIVKIRQGDIIKPLDNKSPLDRHGHELLILRQGAIKPKNILYFLHHSGRYAFKNGGLIKLGEAESPDFA